MRVSIVIAVHNEREHLEKTIASCVAGCATLDHEIIVADDASNDLDETGLIKQFPGIRVSSSRERLGPSPTKDRGARIATGDILLFLDAHCAAEPGAISRLVDVVESGPDDAIIIPTVAALDTETWKVTQNRQGHGYVITLDTFHGQWVSLRQMKSVEIQGRALYESPSLMGCALALRKTHYEKLDGFDLDMRFWGIEDVDLALRCWMLGGQVLHDPQAIIGHRFQPSFSNYSAPREHIVANQMRMARKHLSEAVWKDWLQRCQTRLAALGADAQGLYEAAWAIFSERRESVEEQRAYVLGSRVRDEFWYAEQFGLSWPAKKIVTSPQPELGGFPTAQRLMAAAFSPSPPPEPPRGATSVQTITSSNYVPLTQFAVSQKMASYQTSAWVTQVAGISNALSRISLSGWGGDSYFAWEGAWLASSRASTYQHPGGSSSSDGGAWLGGTYKASSRRQAAIPPKKTSAANAMETFSVTFSQVASPGRIGGNQDEEFKFQLRVGEMRQQTFARIDQIIAKNSAQAQAITALKFQWAHEHFYKHPHISKWTATSFLDWLSKRLEKNPNMDQAAKAVIELLLKEFPKSGNSRGNISALSTSECKMVNGLLSSECDINAPISDVKWGSAPYDGQILWDPAGDCRFAYECSKEMSGRMLDIFRVIPDGRLVWFDKGPVSVTAQ